MYCPALNDLPPAPMGKTGWPWTVETPQLPAAMPDGAPWPRISIVTPSYNQAQFIEETIRSVLLQGYPNLEYIIVDGASTDGTVEIIRRYESWLACWVSEKDMGQSSAINKGLRSSTGKYFAWLASDDAYLAGALQAAACFLAAHADAALAYGNVHFINSESKVLSLWSSKEFVLEEFLAGGVFPQPGCFMRTEAIRTVGGLNPNFHYALDYDLFLRLACRFPAKRIDRTLSSYRLHEDSKTIIAKGSFVREKLRAAQELFRGDLPDSIRILENRALAEQNLNAGIGYFMLGDLENSITCLNHSYSLDAALTPLTEEWGKWLRMQCWEIRPDQFLTFRRRLEPVLESVYGERKIRLNRTWRRIRLLQKKYIGGLAGYLSMLGDLLVAALSDFSWLTRRDVMSDVIRNILGDTLIKLLQKTMRRPSEL